MALASNNLIGMRRHAECATVANSQEMSTGLEKKFATAVIDVLLQSTHPKNIPQLSEEDFLMLRHLVRNRIKIGDFESLREVVLMCHFRLGKFLVEEAGVIPNIDDDDDVNDGAWQIMHAIFMPRFGITAVGKMLLNQKLRNKSSTKDWHGDINLRFVTDISPTYASLFERGSMSQVSVRELRQGANEVHSAFLTMLLKQPAFVKNMCRSRATSTTNRSLMHVVAASSDPASITKLLKITREHHDCSALIEALTAQDAFGFTPADLAARVGDLESLDLLLRATGGKERIEQKTRDLLIKFDPKNNKTRETITSTSRQRNTHRRCDIDQIDVEQLNATYFYRRYFLPRRPLLIKRGCNSWRSMHWSLGYLDRELRDVQATVSVSHIPYATQFGVQEIALTSMRSLPHISTTTNSVPYVFDSTILNQSPKLLRDFPALPWFAEPPAHLNQNVLGLQLDPSQLYVGSRGSGSPMHFHSDALNACFKGEKLYALLPPAESVYSITPLETWLENEENKEKYEHKLLFCTQRRGDVMFIPGMYAHGVVNQKKVIGVATEMLSRNGEDLF